MTIISSAKGIIHPWRPAYRDPDSGLTGGQGPDTYDITVEFDELGAVQWYELKPQEFLLASTIEQFTMPGHLVGHVQDKSTLARKGLSVFNTHIDSGFHGWLTLELVNHGPQSIMLFRGQPIAQVKLECKARSWLSWLRRPAGYDGKYQYQGRGPQRAR